MSHRPAGTRRGCDGPVRDAGLGVLVPPEQIAYILVAVVVAGLALGALLVVALVNRSRRAAENRRAEARAAAREAALAAATLVPAAPAGPPAYGPVPVLSPAVAGPPAEAFGPYARTEEPVSAEPEPIAPAPIAPAPITPAPTGPLGPGVIPAAVETESGRRFVLGDRIHDPRAEEAITSFLSLSPSRPPSEGPVPDPYVDPLTGLDTALAWERELAEENARFVRYRRPVCVVVAELDGLPRLLDRFGPDPARRVLPAVGDALRRLARRTDRVAHAGDGRFYVLLPETDEIQAINYVERVRAACDRWLEAGAVALHLSMGWASPTAVGELPAALRTAEERMYDERRRAHRAEPAEPGSAP